MGTPLCFRTAVRGGADGGGRFQDGQRSRLDLPRTWRLGAGWQFTPSLRGSLGLNAYLEHSARMDMLDDPAAGIDSRRDYRNTWEESAALEYRLDPRWLLSLGVNVNQIGQRRRATLDISLPGAHSDYLSLGTGFQCQVSDRLRLNAGVAGTGFVHRYQNADQGDQALQAAFAASGAAVSPRKEYDKRYLILAFGIDYHLPL
jgi:long-subunit fatty acid transport protein